MRTTKKASGKAAQHNTPSIEEQFRAIAEAYGTDDPELIKQQIMWRYLKLLVTVLVTPGNRADLHTHAQHFDTVIKYEEHVSLVFSSVEE